MSGVTEAYPNPTSSMGTIVDVPLETIDSWVSKIGKTVLPAARASDDPELRQRYLLTLRRFEAAFADADELLRDGSAKTVQAAASEYIKESVTLKAAVGRADYRGALNQLQPKLAAAKALHKASFEKLAAPDFLAGLEYLKKEPPLPRSPHSRHFPAFQLACSELDDCIHEGDYVGAAKAAVTARQLKKVIEKAKALDDEDQTKALATIRRADFNRSQADKFPKLKDVVEAFDDAKAKLASAISEGRKSKDYAKIAEIYEKAYDLKYDVKDAAERLNAPFDILELSQRNQVVFERIDAALEERRRRSVTKRVLAAIAPARPDPVMEKAVGDYEDANADLASAETSDDSLGMARALKAKSKAAVLVLHELNRREYLKGFTSKALDSINSSQKGNDRINASNLKTLPNLATMKQDEILDIVVRSLYKNKKDAETDLAQIYGNAESVGIKLGLPISHILAVNRYTAVDYLDLNAFLRGNIRLTDGGTLKCGNREVSADYVDAVKLRIAVIIEALERLPPYPPGAFPVFRWDNPFKDEKAGIDQMRDRYTVGKVFTVADFWSTGGGAGASTDEKTLELVIWGKSNSACKDISVMSNYFSSNEGARPDRLQLKGQSSGEVLFPINTKFKTIDVQDFSKLSLDERFTRTKHTNAQSFALKYRVTLQEVG